MYPAKKRIVWLCDYNVQKKFVYEKKQETEKEGKECREKNEMGKGNEEQRYGVYYYTSSMPCSRIIL